MLRSKFLVTITRPIWWTYWMLFKFHFRNFINRIIIWWRRIYRIPTFFLIRWCFNRGRMVQYFSIFEEIICVWIRHSIDWPLVLIVRDGGVRLWWCDCAVIIIPVVVVVVVVVVVIKLLCHNRFLHKSLLPRLPLPAPACQRLPRTAPSAMPSAATATMYSCTTQSLSRSAS
jgi:hypothetical protein